MPTGGLVASDSEKKKQKQKQGGLVLANSMKAACPANQVETAKISC